MGLTATSRRLAGVGAAAAFASALLFGVVQGAGTAAAADNIYLVKNGNTGRCLTANNLQEPRNDVFTRDCVGAATQKWRIVGGHFIPQGNAKPLRCLDYGDPFVGTFPCDGGEFQDWSTNGSRTWIKHVSTNSCLNSTGEANALVVLSPCGGGSSRWVTVKV
ncbi:RICIN domain-containing protein [Kibdelosporangium phytohabitans]|uniref:Ricin B lectin domain-containing protein n=1 Tax=Kibdelosporangium phytohabitans TaxID=860235 RepID=A0A0N9HZH9_9PSEU|nr:ricin-type beta-trefoil lectin domain protein [Kibdelosporangium phytohabitans]ALG11144.1 hypothetical protein AOZ06_33480 [Kibdelosporangium phytohabitans]MBE1462397.1 hypothetical protein [Kibdelosporangium phytohabitans]